MKIFLNFWPSVFYIIIVKTNKIKRLGYGNFEKHFTLVINNCIRNNISNNTCSWKNSLALVTTTFAGK